MNTEFRLNSLDSWANGKSPLLTYVAIEMLSAVEALCLILERAKGGQQVGWPDDIPLQQWFRFYRSSKKLMRQQRDEMRNGKATDLYLVLLFDYGMLLRKKLCFKKKRIKYGLLTKLKIRFFAWLVKELFRRGLVKRIIIKIEDILEVQRNELLDTMQSLQGKKLSPYNVLSAPTYFIANVWLVCVLLYGVFPSQLLRKARLGDLDSMQLLFRLDPSTIHDPVISKKMHRLRQTAPDKHKAAVSWATMPPKKKFTRELIKKRLGGFLAFMSQGLSTCSPYPPLTAPEIMALFDAYAMDSKQGPVDPDLADLSPEAFAKAIQREKEFWAFYVNPS